MSVTIRQMQQQDLERVMQIGSISVDPHRSEGFYREESLKGWLEDGAAISLVAENSAGVMGFIFGYCMKGPKTAYLNCMAVDPGYKGRDIAGLLVSEAQTRARQAGCERAFGVVPEMNDAAMRAMRKQGYRRGGRYSLIEREI